MFAIAIIVVYHNAFCAICYASLQGDKLRHLTKYFAAMLDLTGGKDVESVAACL